MPHVHTAPGQIDFTVEVFVVHRDRVLLRLHDKVGKWLSVGGHVELDEDPSEAALREVREEVGLDVRLDDSHMLYREQRPGYRELPPPVFMCRVRIDDDYEHVTMTFFASSPSATVRPSGEDRSDDWRWVTASEVDDPSFELDESIRAYAGEALRRLG